MAYGDRCIRIGLWGILWGMLRVYFWVYFRSGRWHCECLVRPNPSIIYIYIYVYIVGRRSTKSCTKPSGMTTRKESRKHLDTLKCRPGAAGEVEKLSWSSWKGYKIRENRPTLNHNQINLAELTHVEQI